MSDPSRAPAGVHPMMRYVADAAPQRGEVAMRAGLHSARPSISPSSRTEKKCGLPHILCTVRGADMSAVDCVTSLACWSYLNPGLSSSCNMWVQQLDLRVFQPPITRHSQAACKCWQTL